MQSRNQAMHRPLDRAINYGGRDGLERHREAKATRKAAGGDPEATRMTSGLYSVSTIDFSRGSACTSGLQTRQLPPHPSHAAPPSLRSVRSIHSPSLGRTGWIVAGCTAVSQRRSLWTVANRRQECGRGMRSAHKHSYTKRYREGNSSSGKSLPPPH
ncbi:hypothetical protein BO71DRAFT_434825 [Aspergillus ellipticus CBS 707.79]|uniref:Uncharacterized protein n=1 Tax=Aspergillus ellipticus CBS 707.79 TaxID=1448320 RepID=A0A319DMS3_9EURO|nr:hypothetical protein BO71DRAFT_434825 [Aspergillus ellipticus CBS 707.79]